ncbi:MAG: hypothetical protein M4D80_14070 [Myxococcota bacterium]|nr:hypothetical protein [Myxococcota bacterium]
MRLIACTIVVLALGGSADAYPDFQFSTGASRCTECHFAPGGGGLINDYGRDEAGSTISGGGDGRFAHGAFDLPDMLELGGDFRVASLAKRVRGGTEAAVFPMQADLYARVAIGGVSINATGGILGQIREAAPIADRFGSREHYAMYQPESRAWYVRAGRMFPVFGLRLPDHTAYVRRYTGRHTFEESYQVAAGIAGDRWDLHTSVLTPIALHPVVGRHGWGLALHAERTRDASSFSLQLDARRDDDGTRSWFGGTWKHWLEDPDLLFAAELDVGLATTPRDRVGQLAGYASIAYRPGKRWGLGSAAHYFDPDALLLGQERAALDLRFTWFPRAHYEVAVLLRAEAALVTLERSDLLGFLQLHYYL